MGIVKQRVALQKDSRRYASAVRVVKIGKVWSVDRFQAKSTGEIPATMKAENGVQEFLSPPIYTIECRDDGS
jgi:hypothetical protein